MKSLQNLKKNMFLFFSAVLFLNILNIILSSRIHRRADGSRWRSLVYLNVFKCTTAWKTKNRTFLNKKKFILQNQK